MPVAVIRKVVAAPLPWLLPGAPAAVAGVIDLHGTPLVVLDPARRGGAARDAVTLDSRIVILATAAPACGVLCDDIGAVHRVPPDAASADRLPPAPDTGATIRTDDGTLRILGAPGTWLAPEESRALTTALARQQPGTFGMAGAPVAAGPAAGVILSPAPAAVHRNPAPEGAASRGPDGGSDAGQP